MFYKHTVAVAQLFLLLKCAAAFTNMKRNTQTTKCSVKRDNRFLKNQNDILEFSAWWIKLKDSLFVCINILFFLNVSFSSHSYPHLEAPYGAHLENSFETRPSSRKHTGLIGLLFPWKQWIYYILLMNHLVWSCMYIT